MLSGAEPSWLDVNEHSRLTDEVLCGCMRQQIVAIPALTPHPTCAMLLAASSRTSFRAGHHPGLPPGLRGKQSTGLFSGRCGPPPGEGFWELHGSVF